MSVVGICMVKDEADVIGTVVDHMLTQVDWLYVADNGSTDGTRDLLEDRRADGITVVDDPEVAYMQSAKMTALALTAGDNGAEWVVPFDADEWWYSPFGRIGTLLRQVPAQYLTASATLYDHMATARDDEAVEDPVARLGWRRLQPASLPKVACRTRSDLVIHQGNHGASYDGGPTNWPDQLVVRHFPYRSAHQFVTKARNGAAAYAAAGSSLPPDAGLHWRQYGELLERAGEEACEDWFRQWFFVAEPELDDGMIFDPVPQLP